MPDRIHLFNGYALKAFSFLLFYFLIVNNLFSQFKIGTVYMIDDNKLTYCQVNPLMQVQFKENYSLGFNLKEFCISEFDSIFSWYDSYYEIVEMDQHIWDEFIRNRDSLKRKDFKRYATKWFVSDLKEYGYDAMMLIENIDPHIILDNYGTLIETEKLAVFSEKTNKVSAAFIKMRITIYYDVKPKEIATQSFIYLSRDLPIINEGEGFKESEWMEFENIFQKSISNQYLKFLNNNIFMKGMIKDLKNRK
jgi:hypothetical protein